MPLPQRRLPLLTAAHRPKTHRLALLLCAAMTLLPAAAAAHGNDPIPYAVQPLDDEAWIMTTSFGVITSRWPDRYVCEESFLGGTTFEAVALDLDRWIVFTHDSVRRTRDGGCSFEPIMALSEEPSAVALSSDRARFAWIVTAEAMSAQRSALFWSEDGGETIERVELVEAGDVRWTGLSLDGAKTAHIVGYSRQEATRGEARYARLDLERGAVTESSPWAGASYPYLFDSHDGEIVGLARVEGELALLWDTPERALETRRVLQSWPVDLALSPDHLTLLAGGTRGGEAWMLRRGASEPEAISEELLATSCVGWFSDQEIALCARSGRQEFALMGLDVESGARRSRVDFAAMKGPRQGCEPGSEASKVCALVWPELARALRIELPDMGPISEEMGGALDAALSEEMGALPDRDQGAGLSDMGAELEMPSGSSSNNDRSTCSSSSVKSSHDDGSRLMWALVLTCGLLWRRRRRGALELKAQVTRRTR